jgi:hypothetical protein
MDIVIKPKTTCTICCSIDRRMLPTIFIALPCPAPWNTNMQNNNDLVSHGAYVLVYINFF